MGAVVVCRDDGRYLDECLGYIFAQDVRVREIAVVTMTDSSATAPLTRSYADPRIRIVDAQAPSIPFAWRAGVQATGSDIILFLDAGSLLPPGYLAEAVGLLDHQNVGVVYADTELLVDTSTSAELPEFDPAVLERHNLIGDGAVVLRQALATSEALDLLDCQRAPSEWRVWRTITETGFWALRHSLRIQVRSPRPIDERSYYDRAGLADETVTIFVPLFRAVYSWETRLRPWLDCQAWPREQARLVLADMSRSALFGRAIRDWARHADYPDIRVSAFDARADLPDDLDEAATDLVWARVLNRAAGLLAMPFVFIPFGDQTIPGNAVEQLLRAVDEDVAAVSGLHPDDQNGERFVCVPHRDSDFFECDDLDDASSIELSGGMLIRRGAMTRRTGPSETFLYRRGDPFPYDIGFCHRVGKRGGVWKLARDVLSEHAGAPLLPPLPPR